MDRKVAARVRGVRAIDGAGVHLVRVLGRETAEAFDPILMLDSFDSTRPEEYTAGFPMHPHRGIETISYVYQGRMRHKDTLGNEDEIGDGQVQWMNSGSGILHEELVPEAERLLGVQLWLNLPREAKMSRPSYRALGEADIQEIPFEGGYLRLLAGRYGDFQGYQGEYLPLDYYDVHLEAGARLRLETGREEAVMAFTLLGDAVVAGEHILEKTAVKLGKGEALELAAPDAPAQILVIKSRPLGEPIAWAGPIVMNTREELDLAFAQLRRGEFLQGGMDFRV